MNIKPVRIGLILGLASLLFGISWVVYITAGHEDIHEALDRASISAGSEVELPHESHDDGHNHDEAYEGEASEGGGAEEQHHERPAVHDDPVMEEAHRMLAKGHVHAMGLGLLTLCVSLVLSLVCMPRWLKTLGSVSTGVGGLLYPFSWIIMGFKLPALGMEAAESSIMPIVGISVLLVSGGLFITLAGVVAGFFCKESST